METKKRVKFGKSPLVEVILQLRFPTILSINSKEPEEFQEKIRKNFPIYHCAIEQQQEVLIKPDGSQEIVKRANNKNYHFVSRDGLWKINITSSFISISTVKYTVWEDMKDRFGEPLNEFVRIYSPAFYSRIGLRYIDAITKDFLGLEQYEWSDLLQPHIIGTMSVHSEKEIKSYSMNTEYKIDGDNCWAKMSTGLGLINGMENDRNAPAFIIDCDYYKIGNTSLENYCSTVEKLHDASTAFILSAIKDVLRDAMEPEDI